MKGFKTILLGVILALLAIFSDETMQSFISENIPSIGGSIGLLVIILRAITNSSIFHK